jgi:hypothetical protein
VKSKEENACKSLFSAFFESHINIDENGLAWLLSIPSRITIPQAHTKPTGTLLASQQTGSFFCTASETVSSIGQCSFHFVGLFFVSVSVASSMPLPSRRLNLSSSHLPTTPT